MSFFYDIFKQNSFTKTQIIYVTSWEIRQYEKHSGNLWNLFLWSYKNKLPAVLASFPNVLTHCLSQQALVALQSFHLPGPCSWARSVLPPRAHLAADPSCAFPKPWWNVQHTPSGSSASAFLACPSLNRLSYPPMDTVPLLLPAIATSPVGFMLLARLQVPVLPLLLTLRTLIRVSLVGSGM